MPNLRFWAHIGLLMAVACTPRPRRDLSEVLILGLTDEPTTLDPLFNEVSGAQEIIGLLHRDLTRYTRTGSLAAHLALRLPELETSSTVQVRWVLPPNLRWSDGSRLGVADYDMALHVTRDPRLPAVNRQVAQELDSLVGTEDGFVARWQRAYPGFRSPRVHAAVPAHLYPSIDAPTFRPSTFRGLTETYVSNGPYRVARWVRGRQITLERNPHWVGSPAKIPTLVFRFFSSEDAYENEIATGELDALGEASGLSSDRAEAISRRRPEYVAEFRDAGLFLHLESRADHPLTGDPRIRNAIARGIDRLAMAKIVYGGQATPAFGLFSPIHFAQRGPLFSSSATSAAMLLDAAGYLLSGRSNVRERAGERLSLPLMYASGSAASERAALFIQAELARLGMEVRLEAFPMRVLFSKMRAKKQAPLVLFAWRTAPDWDAFAMLHSSGSQNFGGHFDEELDRHLAVAKTDAALARRVEHLHWVEAKVIERMTVIPLLFRRSLSLRPRALVGWAPTGTPTPVTWNAEQWSVP